MAVPLFTSHELYRSCHRSHSLFDGLFTSSICLITKLFSKFRINYLSDPDVFFLREENIKLTQAQKLKLAQINALLGGVLLTSDDPSKYSNDAMKRYRTLLKLRSAENVRVEADNGLSVIYFFNGKERRVDL